MLKVALLTFTRDRLAYTRHCFQTLEQNAGCEYDHYVFDQASTDGTQNWLQNWAGQSQDRRFLHFSETNIGICAAANHLLDHLVDPESYDVIVRYDNDCEVTEPGTLEACAGIASDYEAIVSPRVLGLNNPPPTLKTVSLEGKMFNETPILGGIFMCIPAFVFGEIGFRWNEQVPLASGDEAIVPWWRGQGGLCGYLRDFSVNHYEGTEAQKLRFPDYQARKEQELATGEMRLYSDYCVRNYKDPQAA